MDATPRISPVQRVLLGAAGRHAERAAWAFTLDNECAHIARMAREPIMAQLRLAWWRDALSADQARPEHRTDMTDAIRALPGFVDMREALITMIDGWEELIVDDSADRATMLAAYARGRGDGLFGALALDGQHAGGRVWALWDLAGHSSDAALASAAIEAARELLRAEIGRPRLPRMLAMMAKVSRDDVARGRGAPVGLTIGLYARLLRAQFLSR